MLQVISAITDEELGGTSFVVLRDFYQLQAGEKVHLRQDRYETFGTIHPASIQDLQLLPEEYRADPILLIHSPISLSLGGQVDSLNFTAPDRIIYKSQIWMVISVRDWSSMGFCKAFAVLKRGE